MNINCDETFWSKLDELQRMLICFLRKQTENNCATGNCSKPSEQILNTHGKDADLMANDCDLERKNEK